MYIKFVGAIERVTGSCTWLKHENIQFLVDCGMIQGELHSNYENNQKFIFNSKDIKFVLLTHAHLDHCGLIPRLYKEGFIGKVFCTRATAKLSQAILQDAVQIGGVPYENDDVQLVNYSYIDERPDFKWNTLIPIDNNIFISASRTAHILGAISIGIAWDKENNKSILFTGDIGNNTEKNSYQPLLKHRHSPSQEFAYIVCESTYGSINRDAAEHSLEYRIEQLEKYIIETIYEKKGNLIIPTFSLHRTQEILFDLYYLLNIKWKGGRPNTVKEEHSIKIICDSKLGKRVSSIYEAELLKSVNVNGENKKIYLNKKISHWLNSDTYTIEEIFKKIYAQKTTEIGEHSIFWEIGKKNTITTTEPKIIITSSGMCDAGPILTHLEENLKCESNTIVLTGYQSHGTNGFKLSKLGNLTEEEKLNLMINIGERELNLSDVKAQIVQIKGYSGHADQNSLLNYLFTEEENFKYTIPNIFLNHGDNNARNVLKEKILEKSKYLCNKYGENSSFKTNVIIPKIDDSWYDLDKNEWIKEEEKLNLVITVENLTKSIENLTKSIENLTKEIKRC